MELKVSHCFIPVHDRDEALAFYRDVLGLEVRNDVKRAGLRWETVGPKAQPDVNLVLEPPAANPNASSDDRQVMSELLANGMLRAIIGNLVGNAIKYTERGRVLVGCRKRASYLSIEVLDSGSGIPAEQFSAIFDAFHQINPASEGLGLGLSIVRRTAEALGHRIALKSDLARGSHFTVLVPLAATVAAK